MATVTSSKTSMSICRFLLTLRMRVCSVSVGAGGRIQNVGLTGEHMSVSVRNSSDANTYAGGLVGYAQGSTVRNCYSTGAVLSEVLGTGWSYAGGLVGIAEAAMLRNCYSKGSATSTSDTANAGGLLGVARDATVVNSYAMGEVSGTHVGGLVGQSFGSTTISGSYHLGLVSSGTGNTLRYSRVGDGAEGADFVSFWLE